MPRRPRLHLPGGLYHVILRGNGRGEIFFDADDRRHWQSLIEKGLDRFEHRIHAYCWMTNHVHLAIQCGDLPLSNFISFVASQYARSTNKKLNRSGHLFERRHRAILVQADSYLKELIRYIHLNPLRAGLVDALSDYEWSSHAAYVSGEAPNWLTLDWVLSAFGETHADARQCYARFMQVDCRSSIEDKLRRGQDDDTRVLGDDGFIASLGSIGHRAATHQTLDDLALAVAQQYGVTIAELKSLSRERKFSRIRAEIALAAIEGGVTTNAEVARYFNRSQSVLSLAVSRLRKRARGTNK